MIGCLKALKKSVLAGAVFLAVTVRAAGLPLEWLLLTGDVRDRLVDVLLREERLDELDFLMSVWEGDEWGAEAAARTLVDQTHDPEMTRWLAGYLRRTGREDEADRLDPPRLRSRALKAAAPARTAPEVSSHRPVVFLHGYNGSAETWVDFVRVFGSAGYAKDDMLVFDYGADFAADEDTPIELLAANVVSKVRAWLRWRAGLAEGDTSHDADLPAPDFPRTMSRMTPMCLRRIGSAIRWADSSSAWC